SDVGHTSHAESPVGHADLLGAVRVGDDGTASFDDRGRAVRTGTVSVKKSGEDIDRDVGASESDERPATESWKSEGEDGISRVRVDRRFGDRKGAGALRGFVVGQCPDVEGGVDRILTDRVRPHVEEGAMAAAVLAG